MCVLKCWVQERVGGRVLWLHGWIREAMIANEHAHWYCVSCCVCAPQLLGERDLKKIVTAFKARYDSVAEVCASDVWSGGGGGGVGSASHSGVGGVGVVGTSSGVGGGCVWLIRSQRKSHRDN